MDGLSPGRVLADRYELIEPLRDGANGVVWRALDRLTNDEVALKFAAGAAAALAAEYQRLQAVTHPAIVRALALNDDPPSLVMELVDGPELRSAMGADYRRWLALLRPALDGLAAAHAAGVVHGDLSLQNIVIGSDGRARLVDFAPRPDAGVNDDLRDLGVLMHKLATGGEPGAGTRDDASLPPALAALISTLVEDPAATSVEAVRRDIDRLLGASDGFERIAPTDRRRSTESPPVAAAPAPASSERHWGPFVVFTLVALGVVVAFFAFVRFGAEAPDAAATDTVEQAGTRLESQRAEAEALRAEVYEKWLALESLDVREWAEVRADAALARLTEGERLLSELDTLGAARELRAADTLMTALQTEAPAIAAFHRDAGWRAWDGGDAETATRHFRAVLAIDPGDERVRAALGRAQFLDEVTALRREAQDLRAAGDTRAAIERLREAQRIDPADARLAAEIDELSQAQQAQDFRQAMSRAYAALRSGSHARARAALAEAAALRPDAPELHDARTELAVAERNAEIARLREAAIVAEQAQRWETAIGLYGELLQLDEALVFAREGRDRSRLLASLTARAQSLLDDPEFDRDETRRRAENVIAQIADVRAEASALRSLARQLEQRLAQSREPVPVQLQSDNETVVTIYRVGRLGRFASETVALVPGQYTVLGTREGFRDVRRELVVRAGEPVASFVIKCEERI